MRIRPLTSTEFLESVSGRTRYPSWLLDPEITKQINWTTHNPVVFQMYWCDSKIGPFRHFVYAEHREILLWIQEHHSPWPPLDLLTLPPTDQPPQPMVPDPKVKQHWTYAMNAISRPIELEIQSGLPFAEAINRLARDVAKIGGWTSLECHLILNYWTCLYHQ